jgi:hypothetical protein
LETLKGTDILGDLDVDMRVILKCLFKKYVVRLCTGFYLFNTGHGGGNEHGKETSGSTDGAFLDFLRSLSNSQGP